MSDDVTITPLTAEAWRDLKTLRIAALTDAPDAFGPLAADAEAESDAYWRERAANLAARNLEIFIARRGGEGVGLVSAHLSGEAVGSIGAMWVDPALRGVGLGRRLLERACESLIARGAKRLRLWVTDGNTRAMALYESEGFERTGITEPLRAGSELVNVQMEKLADA
jgi:ribosomal protein S18 acetylase RimI-like enzyme